MKTKIVITLVLALVLIFSMSLAVAASTAPGVQPPGLQMANTPDQGEAPVPEELPAPPVTQRSSNTPYFIGAGIAILLFIGVAIYCKKHGNKTF